MIAMFRSPLLTLNFLPLAGAAESPFFTDNLCFAAAESGFYWPISFLKLPISLLFLAISLLLLAISLFLLPIAIFRWRKIFCFYQSPFSAGEKYFDFANCHFPMAKNILILPIAIFRWRKLFCFYQSPFSAGEIYFCFCHLPFSAGEKSFVFTNRRFPLAKNILFLPIAVFRWGKIF